MNHTKSVNVLRWHLVVAFTCALLAISAPGVALAFEVDAATPSSVPTLSIKVPAKTRRATRNGWVKKGEDWCYYTNGVAAKGWKKIGGKWYYFDPDSKNAYSDGEYEINGKYYGFDSSCAMITGWGKWVTENDDGTTWIDWTWSDASGAQVSGWKYINKKWYYFDPGSMYAYSDGFYEIKGKYYGFDSSYAMVTGWHKWVYEDDDGYKSVNWSWSDSGGVAASGWKYINKKWYYFDPDTMYAYSDGFYEVKGKYYGFDPSCAMVTGWHKWVYEDDDGYKSVNWSWSDSGGVAASGWKYINKKWYYFDPDTMYAYSDNDYEIKGKWYGFDSSCAMIVGWHKWGDDDWGYWTWSDASGVEATGWKDINGKRYYFDPDGRYAYSNGEYEIDGKTYNFDSSCAMVTGWHEWDDGWAYYGSDGAMYTGTQTVEGVTYDFGEDGRVYK